MAKFLLYRQNPTYYVNFHISELIYKKTTGKNPGFDIYFPFFDIYFPFF